jgi:hypothetical protein
VRLRSLSSVAHSPVKADHQFRVLFVGTVIGGLNARRGTIIDSEVRDEEFVCTADVALNDMFGYSNHLRGTTQGKGMLALTLSCHFIFLLHLFPSLSFFFTFSFGLSDLYRVLIVSSCTPR